LQNFVKNNLCKVSRRRARDRNPSRPRRDLRPSRPRLQKMGLETRLETENKSRDSVTDEYNFIQLDAHTMDFVSGQTNKLN